MDEREYGEALRKGYDAGYEKGFADAIALLERVRDGKAVVIPPREASR